MEVAKDIATLGKNMDGVIATIELTLKASAMARHMGSSVESDKLDAMRSLVEITSELKAKVGKLGLDTSTQTSATDFMEPIGVKELGYKAFLAKLESFRVDVKALLGGVILATTDSSAGQEVVKRAATSIKSSEHEALQLSAFSNTPAFDQDVLSMVTSTLLDFTENIGVALCMSSSIPEGYEPNTKMTNALQELVKVEVTKPKLLRVAEEADVDEFLAVAQRLHEAMTPVLDDFVSSLATKATSAVAKVSDMLAEASGGGSDRQTTGHSCRCLSLGCLLFILDAECHSSVTPMWAS